MGAGGFDHFPVVLHHDDLGARGCGGNVNGGCGRGNHARGQHDKAGHGGGHGFGGAGSADGASTAAGTGGSAKSLNDAQRSSHKRKPYNWFAQLSASVRNYFSQFNPISG